MICYVNLLDLTIRNWNFIQTLGFSVPTIGVSLAKTWGFSESTHGDFTHKSRVIFHVIYGMQQAKIVGFGLNNTHSGIFQFVVARAVSVLGSGR